MVTKILCLMFFFISQPLTDKIFRLEADVDMKAHAKTDRNNCTGKLLMHRIISPATAGAYRAYFTEDIASARGFVCIWVSNALYTTLIITRINVQYLASTARVPPCDRYIWILITKNWAETDHAYIVGSEFQKINSKNFHFVKIRFKLVASPPGELSVKVIFLIMYQKKQGRLT